MLMFITVNCQTLRVIISAH